MCPRIFAIVKFSQLLTPTVIRWPLLFQLSSKHSLHNKDEGSDSRQLSDWMYNLSTHLQYLFFFFFSLFSFLSFSSLSQAFPFYFCSVLLFFILSFSFLLFSFFTFSFVFLFFFFSSFSFVFLFCCYFLFYFFPLLFFSFFPFLSFRFF